MKSLGLFSQIVAAGLSLTIGYFYVQPTVAEIGETQTETAQYETERRKIESINNQLAMHLATLDSIPPTDRERLVTYMPRAIDEVSVMRDISFIVERANVDNIGLSYDGPLDGRQTILSRGNDADSRQGRQPATPHAFTVDIEGTYDEIKNFLRLLELNEYPLEINQLSLSSNDAVAVQEGDNAPMTVNVTLVTFVGDLSLINDN